MYEHPPNFLDTIDAQIKSFVQSSASRSRSLGARVRATRAIKATIERGLAVVLRLDAIVRNKFADDPATLAEWESAGHTESALRAAKAKSPANPTSPAK
jgi:hypothetical protein